MMAKILCSEQDVTRVAECWVTLVWDQPMRRFPGLSEPALPLLGLMAAVLDHGRQANGGVQALEHFVQRLMIPLQLTRFDQLVEGFLGETDEMALSRRLWGTSRRRAVRRLRSLTQAFEALGIRQVEDLARWLRADGRAVALASLCHGWTTRQCQWLIWRCIPSVMPLSDAFRLVAERTLGRRLPLAWLHSARHQLGLLAFGLEESKIAICALDEPGWIARYDRPGLRVIFWKRLIDRLQAVFHGSEVIGEDPVMLRYAEGGACWACSNHVDRITIYLNQSSWMEGYHLRLSVHGPEETGQGLAPPILAELSQRGWLSGSNTFFAFSCDLATTSVMPPQSTLSSINTHIERVVTEVVAQLEVLWAAFGSGTNAD